jgi:HK97 gp10 family phage protein
MKVKVGLEGLSELQAALEALPTATGKNVAKRVLLRAAEPIQQDAQLLAPSRPASASDEFYHYRGELRLRLPGTLKVLVEEGSRLTPNQARLARQQGKSFSEVYVGTRDPIGRLQEFGTAHAPPAPFLRPAWEAQKDQALQIIKSELGDEIAKAAQRLARKAAKG